MQIVAHKLQKYAVKVTKYSILTQKIQKFNEQVKLYWKKDTLKKYFQPKNGECRARGVHRIILYRNLTDNKRVRSLLASH